MMEQQRGKVYVVGHKNPDTDSICSAIAYANLKREIRQSRYRTQENFAFEFGAEPRTVSRWLNEGLRDMDVAQEIAELLEIEVLGLFVEGGEKKGCII